MLFDIYRYMGHITLQGNWIKKGTYYTSPQHRFSLIITERKYPTENKPNKYILIKYPIGKIEYLSGLFPSATEGVYRIDFQGKKYTFEFLNTTQALIKTRVL